MRTIGGLPIVKESAAKFPFGATIQNETDTQDGTPVVREIYGDIVMNNYKLLELTGITPTEDEDSDDTQYQIVDALKRLPNVLNDIEQVLTKTGLVFSVPFNLDLLPNKYFFIGRASDAYVSSETNTFKGTTATEYPFISPTGFNGSDEVLVVIDSSEVRAYSLTMLTSSPDEVFTTMGIPLSFNDTNTMYFSELGNLITGLPSVYDLQGNIRADQSDGTLIVESMVVLKGYIACYVTRPADVSYGKIFCFDLNDLVTPIEFTETGSTILRGEFDTVMYSDGINLYFTNEAGNTSLDDSITTFGFDTDLNEINFISTVTMNAAFDKTENAVVKDGNIYTFITGKLRKFELSTGNFIGLWDYLSLDGKIFQFNGNVYFSSGEVAKKWII